MKKIILPFLFLLSIAGNCQTKQYRTTAILEKKGNHIIVSAVNLFDSTDHATLYKHWVGGLFTNKTSIKEGTIFTWSAEGIGRRKEHLIVNP